MGFRGTQFFNFGSPDSGIRVTVNPRNLETGLRAVGAGIPYRLPSRPLRIEAIGFPTVGLRP